jgi:hypothetical protein
LNLAIIKDYYKTIWLYVSKTLPLPDTELLSDKQYSMNRPKSQDQGVLRDLGVGRLDPNLDRHDRLSAPPVAKGEKLGGLVHPITDPFGAKPDHGTL